MLRPMLRMLVFATLLCACLSEAGAQDAGFRLLFDGETLAGWEGDPETFRVEDGAIVAGTLDAPIPANAFLCTTEEYGDFELRLKARLVGPGDNAGVQFRSRRVPDDHEVSGYQADMGTVSRDWFYGVIGVETSGPDAPAPIWGALYDEFRRDRYLAWSLPDEVAPVLRPGGWNEMTVRAEGPRIQIWVNGIRTVDYTERAHVPRSGVICLQVHSGAPAEAWHKELFIREIHEGR